jgi:hypothetical protein
VGGSVDAVGEAADDREPRACQLRREASGGLAPSGRRTARSNDGDRRLLERADSGRVGQPRVHVEHERGVGDLEQAGREAGLPLEEEPEAAAARALELGPGGRDRGIAREATRDALRTEPFEVAWTPPEDLLGGPERLDQPAGRGPVQTRHVPKRDPERGVGHGNPTGTCG